MNIDERLEKLTERHEALTGHVEILTHDLNRMRSMMEDIMLGVARLAHVADSHEKRISTLEDGKNEG